LSIVFGRKVKDKTTGELVELYPSMKLEAGDQLFLFPNDKRGNEKAPDYSLAVAEKSQEVKSGEEELMPEEAVA
jgi:hypothetical protein